MRHVTILICAIFAAIAATSAVAAKAQAADSWKLVQFVGDIQVSAPGSVTPIAVKPSDPLPTGATITTGPNGRAVLLRGRETIVMSPSSRVTLPNGNDQDVSRVQQQSGTLLFKIGKKPEAHFEVDTPYLAAVVKGTTFTVRVQSASASVHVLEGAVEVATKSRSQSFLTRAGQISSVFAQTANDIFTTGTWNLNTGGDSAWDSGGATFEVPSNGGSAEYGQTRVFRDSGLRAARPLGASEGEITGRTIGKMLFAFEATQATLASSQSKSVTAKPKDGSVVVTSDIASRPSASAKDHLDEQAAAQRAAAARARARVWTVTQVQGAVRVDGSPYAVAGRGLMRTLPVGARVDTGPDGRLAASLGRKEYVIEPNSSAILGDAEDGDAPLLISGRAFERTNGDGREADVRRIKTEDVAALLSRNEARARAAAKGLVSQSGANSKTASVDIPIGVPRVSPVQERKTEEVRTQVLSGVTLGLYALTATLLLAVTARWAWRRYRSKTTEPEPETAAQARLRSVKES